MGRLCTGGSSEIGPKGRVSDDRERSECSMVTGSAWGIMATDFWGLLGVDVVFKCSMVTGSAWGIMAAYFWGLLGVDGCIQMFGGVRTGLLLCVFPLFAYHN